MKTRFKQRTYGHYCPMARSLDLLGERWTLLVLRNLLLGPQRYKDLLEGIPGIGTNLLSARLRQLAAAGVVRRRRLPPPAGSQVYEFTDYGRQLEPILLDLARWGMASIGPRRAGEVILSGWSPLGLRISFRPEGARGLHEVYEFRIEDDVFHARVDDGRLVVALGAAVDPQVVVTCSAETFLGLGAGRVDPIEALRGGLLRVEGEPEAIAHYRSVFQLVVGRPAAGA